MAIFKCKMCGGDLEIIEGASVAECLYCGSVQTLPKLCDDRRANLYDRANHFRRNNEYDKAMGIYEQILNEESNDAEAYWSLVLCKYGIEYVEDPKTHQRVPTVNRVQFTSVTADEDYKSAIKYADAAQKKIYKAEAKAIDDIQRGILEISQKEEPFDVFICYKETDANGRRTPDSVLATELYHELTKEGFKVFFSRIILEDKLGAAYEPYIFAALNSSKAMVVLGTKSKYFNAVWVKNEWSRYLSLIKNGAKKTLIPAYRDMDPYDLPEEFSHLQAQNMSKLGFMQDLVRGIKKIIGESEPAPAAKKTVVVNSGLANVAPLLERVFMFLEDGKWQEADEYCEKVLDIEPKNAKAYLGKLMSELKVRKQEDLKNCAQPFESNDNYQKALRFADKNLADTLKGYILYINNRNEEARKNGIYNSAVSRMRKAISESDYITAAKDFKSILGYKDANVLAERCIDEAEKAKALRLEKEEADRLEAERRSEEKRIATEKRKAKSKKTLKIIAAVVTAFIVFIIILDSVIIPNNKYNKALALMNGKNYYEAISTFETMNGYKDSKEKITDCKNAIKDIKYNEATALIEDKKYDEAYKFLEEIGADEKISESMYARATEYLEAKDYERAYELLNQLGDTEQINAIVYNRAVEYEKNGDKSSAYLLFSRIADYKDSNDKANKNKPFYIENQLKKAQIGKTIKFGKYEQDCTIDNGKEEIEWQVLAKESGKVLVISKYALDCKSFHKSGEVTWEKCTLRKWLNETFYNEAFDKIEQKAIRNTTVTADNNAKYGSNPGRATTDKVFLLSIKEAERYFKTDKSRMCISTGFAKSNGARSSAVTSINGEYTCTWWLRSPGYADMFAAVVGYEGQMHYDGNMVDTKFLCVRPALWISLDS